MDDSSHGIGTAHESYAFACLSCGHGWERDFDIEHHPGGEGRAAVSYVADGVRVPSPLTRPGCLNCGSHTVRIMRAGLVASAADSPWRRRRAPEAVGVPARAGRRRRHWHLPDFRRHFHRRKRMRRAF
ncbi:hypothetical protein KBZ10_12175 [Streptomyces sp. F63]|uniref:hypothetical protein n=1 Tax=Streptomyces sp. F63 TaxID=2824887 RepID=UPI001B376ACD|nr:hypothetical protein [Streptomyces sp. F63]MBQ0985264.1 hypothetical protein [Streptomyces sp. F63]